MPGFSGKKVQNDPIRTEGGVRIYRAIFGVYKDFNERRSSQRSPKSSVISVPKFVAVNSTFPP